MELPEIGSSFLGRYAKVKCPVTRPLLPLFECISNSLDAFDLSKIGETVDVYILRDKQTIPLDGDEKHNEIIGFEIVDNGIGLNKETFDSFREIDTTYKSHIGGKGIGRLTWLKAFKEVTISSIYTENGSHYKRTMELEESAKLFKSYNNKKIDSTPLKTIVKLCYFKDEFKQHINKTNNIIADKIICHFMPRYLKGTQYKIRYHRHSRWYEDAPSKGA